MGEFSSNKQHTAIWYLHETSEIFSHKEKYIQAYLNSTELLPGWFTNFSSNYLFGFMVCQTTVKFSSSVFSLSMNSTGNACYQSCPKLNNFARARNWINDQEMFRISWGSGINWEWDQVESLARCRRCRNGIGKKVIGNSQQEKERGILFRLSPRKLLVIGPFINSISMCC